MKKIHTISLFLAGAALLGFLVIALRVYAASSPSLGLANTFSILASTFTNTVPGTTLSGDLGYTTGPAVAPTVGGSTHVADSTYNQAGIDQNSALAYLNTQSCTHVFPSGAVDLAANTDFPTATYGPGVYCVLGAATIGTGGITLSGGGTYIFRSTGALNTVASSTVTTVGGASACSAWWTPGAATTLGANSNFFGTVIDNAGITIGSTVAWIGRALSFGGTVTTDTDTLTTPVCATPQATLTLTKIVINDNGGTKVVSDFPLFINGSSMTSGVASTTLAPGVYTVSEATSSGYAAGSWTGDCAADGTISLAGGDVKACSVTNDDIATIPAFAAVGPGRGISGQTQATTSVIVTSITVATTSTSSVAVATSATAAATTTPAAFTPTLPNTGFGPQASSVPYSAALVTAILLPFAGLMALVYFMRRKRVA